MSSLLENRSLDDAFVIQMAAHASDFVLAGSETTATALSCITYYVLRTPQVLQKLQHEIRGSYKDYSEIDAASTATLPYIKATILEALRIYPPLPFALPRVVPSGGDTVDGYFLPAGVRSSHLSNCVVKANSRIRLWCLLILSHQAWMRQIFQMLWISGRRGGLIRMIKIYSTQVNPSHSGQEAVLVAGMCLYTSLGTST